MSEVESKPSNAWYLLPIIFSLVGGIIGYFALKSRDKLMADKILFLGLMIFALMMTSLPLGGGGLIIGEIIAIILSFIVFRYRGEMFEKK